MLHTESDSQERFLDLARDKFKFGFRIGRHYHDANLLAVVTLRYVAAMSN
jgi:hypothetical protein